MAKVSVVVTVLNERESIQELIAVLIKQTKDVVIVDGGSMDGTWEYLQSQTNIKAFQKIGNRSVGRNFGVSKTKAKIIAFTDGSCTPNRDWLEKLVSPFADPAIWVVSGYYKGISANAFEKSLIPYVLVMPDKLGGEFLPATRSMAILKSVFKRSGGFDEKLWHNEDYEFAVRLKKSGVAFTFVREAIVEWLPRKNLKSAAWMFMRFAIGDAQAGILRQSVKLLFARYYIFAFLCFVNPWFLWLILPYLIWAIWKNYKYVKMWQAMFWLPLLQITADIMVLFGTIVGLLSRIK